MSGVQTEIRLTIKDAASAGLRSASKEAESLASKSAAAAKASASESVAAMKGLQDGHVKAYRAIAEARKTLGIRAEQEVRADIKRTEEAYQRLAHSGTLSANQQARAYDAMRASVTRLKNEMGEVSRLQKAMPVLKTAAATGAGLVAAGYVLKTPASAAMSFDERLAHMSNTAFSDRGTEGRRLGMGELERVINRSVGAGGGGTREQAAEALDALLASGALSDSESISMLPQLMRFSTASDARATEMANIAIRAKQTFKIQLGDLPNVFNMAIAGGQAGGFDLIDMAKWLPQQMAAATLSGLSGRSGFAKLVALNQVAAITAGTKDEAGNNVVNLLAKINGQDTANDAKKLGINLPKYLQEERAKGRDSVDAFAALVDKTVARRADYQILKKRLSTAGNNTERRETLESMTTIAQGAGIGKLIQDRQALMALLGLMNNRAYMQDVLSKVQQNDVPVGGAGDRNYALVSETAAFKLRQAEQQKDIGYKSAMDGLTPIIGKAADAFSDLAQKHPLLAGSTVLATGAVTAFAGATGLATVAMGGKGAMSGVGLLSSPVAGNALRAAKVGGVAGAAALAGGFVLDKSFGESSAMARYGSSALTGASLGATFGSIVPVLGTGVGALIGGGLGLAMEGVKDFLKPAAQKPLDVNARFQVGLGPGLVLQGQTMQSSGGNVQMDTGSHWGAP